MALPAKARERAEYMLSGEKNKSEFVPSIKRSVMNEEKVYLLPGVPDRRHERIPQKKILGNNDRRINLSHTKHLFNTDCTRMWRIMG